MANKNFGFSLIELVVVVVIMSVLLSIAIPNLIKYIKKYRIESEINTLYANMVEQRFQSMKSGVPHGVVFDSTSKYTLFEFEDKNYNLVFDGIDEERGKKSVDIPYPFNSDVVGKVVMFDSAGIARKEDWGLCSLTIYVNSPAGYNCIAISASRIKMGVWDGSNCKIK